MTYKGARKGFDFIMISCLNAHTLTIFIMSVTITGKILVKFKLILMKVCSILTVVLHVNDDLADEQDMAALCLEYSD